MLVLLPVIVVLAVEDGPAGQIAYVSGTEQEDRRVCILDLGTWTVTPIGRGDRDGRPVWSPDGSWVAFESGQPEGTSIFVVRPDGSELHPFKHSKLWNRYPTWSPLPEDPRQPYHPRLAYAASDGDPRNEVICIYDLKSDTERVYGGDRTGLTRPVWLGHSKLVAVLQAELEERGEEDWALWAEVSPEPEETLLAIGLAGTVGDNLTTDIFVVTPNRALPLPAYVLPSRGDYVEWAVEPSPDGKRVAFESNDGGDREIFVMTHKGAADITNHHTADWNPVWSPEGDWLAFESFRSGRRGVYRVNPETALVIPVAASDGAECWAPTWSPDGRWLAYVSNQRGNPDIVVSGVTGKPRIEATHFEGEDIAPAWRPEPAR